MNKSSLIAGSLFTIAAILNISFLKKIMFFLVFILVVWGLYNVYKSLNSITETDFVYNTVYSEKFREPLFNDRLIGKSKNQILEILGSPFSETSLPYFDAILYTNKKDSVYLSYNSTGVGINCTDSELKFLFISFDSLGNIRQVFIHEYPYSETEVRGMNKRQVLEKYGSPQKALLFNCRCQVWSYSKIKDGSYSGKHPLINIRNLVFNKSDLVEKVVKAQGSTFDKTVGLLP